MEGRIYKTAEQHEHLVAQPQSAMYAYQGCLLGFREVALDRTESG